MATMAKHAVLSAGAAAWASLACARSQLRLDLTLGCGQTFRWRETGDGHWTGVMGGRVWTLTQTDDRLWYHAYGAHPDVHTEEDNREGKGKACGSVQQLNKSEIKRRKVNVKAEERDEPVTVAVKREAEEDMLVDYFQLHVDLEGLYREWSLADPHFKHIANIFTGIRMLRQDPTECLFSFICTSNNHISRIQGMVENLCRSLGRPLWELDGTTYYDFPPLSALADGKVESLLRDLGFGYRARFLQQSAKQILENHGPDWLQGLRSTPYLQARDALRSLPGVGIKVADCACLMSLDKADAVPVDTHVWQIAKRDYKCAAGSAQKTLTDKVHRDIGDFFRQLWGPYAGWAQSVLFCADLKKFQKLKEMLSVKLEDDNKDSLPIKKAKIKMEKQETVNKTEKPRSVRHKKAKLAAQKK
ncbi:N-glycosylase/DNA lyase [Merluccius polli]|uniref:N-glycosylase/DNA lyase n=1 Tax=Merluccius polli TaxID=89951 RepID=A0AA47N0F2_MERPO|nr:N-glycosylase/DNA lyase [Merluccius polli]